MSERLRWKRLAERLRADAMPALLVTHLPDVRYLCGFTGSSAVLVVLATDRGIRARLFTDGRYRDQARAEVRGAAVRITKGSSLQEAVQWLADSETTVCGIDAAHTSLATQSQIHKTLRHGTGKCRLRPMSSLITALREVKDATEHQQLARAAALGCELYNDLLAFIQPEQREIDIAAELEYRARRAGAEGMSFETIVAAGVRSSMPHARATETPVRPGEMLTLDFGIMLRHDPHIAGRSRRHACRAPPAARDL